MRKRILLIAGTRPEVIKLAPLVFAFRKEITRFETLYVSTGQHREMLDQTHSVFGLKPDLDLELMAPQQTLAGLTSALFHSIEGVLKSFQPDVIIVQGDTTTAFVGAMCGFYSRIPVAHIEAGLRTGDRWSPFPEEINRTFISKLATWHFAPTKVSFENLVAEGIPESSVSVVGNTIVDALQWVREHSALCPDAGIPEPLTQLDINVRLILVTSHRRESLGSKLTDICTAIRRLADAFPDVVFVYPVHLNPLVTGPVQAELSGHPRIFLLPPVSYRSLLWLMSRSYLILSDSGGIQEEAPSFSKPLLVLRDNTERPEVVTAGLAKLVGTDPELIFAEASSLLVDENAYQRMAGTTNPFGDGFAAQRILETIATSFEKQ